jgi:polyhydroxyalkanoate synthesis regulator phasin
MPTSKSSGRSSRSKASSARKGSSTRKHTQARKPEPEQTREQLRRLIDPREVVVMTRSRLQEALDEAVERGRMTRDDAGTLLAELLKRGREDIEGLLDGARSTTRGGAERVLREVDRARRAAGVGPSFPVLGYDDLTAAQVIERLGDLQAPELRKVRDYEKRNANRKSVLAAIEQKLK